MPKHSRKRQKTKAGEIQPLGAQISVADDVDKDDEERQLESFLFGVPFVPSGKGKENIFVLSEDEEEGGKVTAGKETENLADEEVCNKFLLRQLSNLALCLLLAFLHRR